MTIFFFLFCFIIITKNKFLHRQRRGKNLTMITNNNKNAPIIVKIKLLFSLLILSALWDQRLDYCFVLFSLRQHVTQQQQQQQTARESNDFFSGSE
jgi:hypothetical protein